MLCPSIDSFAKELGIEQGVAKQPAAQRGAKTCATRLWNVDEQKPVAVGEQHEKQWTIGTMPIAERIAREAMGNSVFLVTIAEQSETFGLWSRYRPNRVIGCRIPGRTPGRWQAELRITG